MMKTTATALLIFMSFAAPGLCQTSGPSSATPSEASGSPSLIACKTAALRTLSATKPEITDIYIDEDGVTIAPAETRIEDTLITRIIMGEASLRTDKSDKPRRFLCLIGEKGKVLLTFFTAR